MFEESKPKRSRIGDSGGSRLSKPIKETMGGAKEPSENEKGNAAVQSRADKRGRTGLWAGIINRGLSQALLAWAS